MLRTPDLAHATTPQQLNKFVTSHFTRFRNSCSESVEKARKDNRDRRNQYVWKRHEQQHKRRGCRLVVGISRNNQGSRSHCRGRKGGQRSLTESVRNDENE